MIDFGIRNLTLFFKDRGAVIMSFLAEFIVIGLYGLFMRDNLINSFPELRQAETIMDVWMISGVLGITPITTAMGAYGVMVDDKMKNADRDFATWPVSRWSLLGGYLFSAIITGLVMSLVLLILSEIYIFKIYGLWAGEAELLRIYGFIAVNAVFGAAMTMLIVSFIKTGNALAACCTIIGSLIGFLAGIYLPMGSLPENVQLLVKGFPVSHSVVLIRQALMSDMIRESLGGANSQNSYNFMEYMGIRYEIEDHIITQTESIVFLLLAASICIAVTGIMVSLKNRS